MSGFHLVGSLNGLIGSGTGVATYPAYHFILNGQGFMMPPGGWSRKLGQQYAAKLSTAGMSQNDRLGNQTVEIDDWSDGEGLLRHEAGTNRYRRGSGINIYDEDGSVGLGPYMAAPAALQTAFNSITCMLAYYGYLILGRNDGKVYSWDGTTLTLLGDTGKTSGGITSLGIIDNVVYIGNGQDGTVYRWISGGSFAGLFTVMPWIPGGAGPTITGVHGLIRDMRNSGVFGLYAASQSGQAGGVVGLTVASGNTDPLEASALRLPDAYPAILLSFGDGFLVGAVDVGGRYSRIYSGTSSTPITWTHRAYVRDAIFTCGVVIGRNAYFGDSIQGRIWKWDGSSITLYRQIGSDLAPYTGSITGITDWRGALWAAIKDADGTCALLRDDGNGAWSRPVTGLTGTTPGSLAIWQDQLHYATQATGAAKVFRTNGTFAATGWVESGLINANLTGTSKLWTAAQVNHSKLVTSQSVQVLYQIEDDGVWVSLGTNSTVGTTTVTFEFPAAVMAEQISFKIVKVGPAGGTTPLKVFALVPRYLPSPGAGREWSLRVLLHGTTQKKMPRADGSDEPLTGEQLSASMWAMVDAVQPVTLVDIDRTEYTVQILEYSEALAASKGQFGADALGWEMDGTLRLREVGT